MNNNVDSAKQVVLSTCVSMCSSCMDFHVNAVHVHCLEGVKVLQHVSQMSQKAL